MISEGDLKSFLHTLKTRWKIFELDGCEGTGKACLVFPPKSEGAQVVDLTKLRCFLSKGGRDWNSTYGADSTRTPSRI